MALIFYGHLVHEHPHLHPRCLPLCPPWGVLGVTRAGAPGTAQWLSGAGAQAEAELGVDAVAGEAGLIFQLLFLSGNPSLPTVQCGGPQGTRWLPQLEPDTICTLPALPCWRARPPGRGQRLLRHRDIVPTPLPGPWRGVAGKKELGSRATSSRHLSLQARLPSPPATLRLGTLHHS